MTWDFGMAVLVIGILCGEEDYTVRSKKCYMNCCVLLDQKSLQQPKIIAQGGNTVVMASLV